MFDTGMQRGALQTLSVVVVATVIGLSSCARNDEDGPRREVVLYSSVDMVFLRELVSEFERETGISVRLVGDTEATKTFGLVQRLISERERPRADVWWSSEPFGTIMLAGEGILEPHESEAAEAAFEEGWPRSRRCADGTWYGLADRARVIVYNTDRVDSMLIPRTLWDLTEERFRGRVGIARPEFGTTRGHMGALLAVYGEEALREWLGALKANDVRLYPGNMDVVRAVGRGEITVGLTDTDDVWVGIANEWPVDMSYERNDIARGALPETLAVGMGPFVIPNTVGLVRGRPNPEEAEILLDWILTGPAELLLAESNSRNIPVKPETAEQFSHLAVPNPAEVDLERIAEVLDEALRLCDEILGG